MKTISEAQGTIGEKKRDKKRNKTLDSNVKSALSSSSNLLKSVINGASPNILHLCLDLKRKIEGLEKEYGVSLL